MRIFRAISPGVSGTVSGHNLGVETRHHQLVTISSALDSRTPDIGGLKMSAFSSGRLPNGVAQMQLGAWKDGFGLIEFFADCRDGTRTMRRALCSQGDAQLRFGDLEISRAGESGLDQGSAFVVRSAIMRRHQSE